MPGQREVAAALVVTVAAAPQLEFGPHLVERPAAFHRDGVWWHADAHLDTSRVAALPVAYPELRLLRLRKVVGQVEVFSLAD